MNVNGLGLTSMRWREKLPAFSHAHLIPDAQNGTKHIVKGSMFTTYDTLEAMRKIARAYSHEAKELANFLKKETRAETLRNIYNFFWQHYNYALDGVEYDEGDRPEEIRTLARGFADRQRGNDCDDFATQISQILINLNIPHAFRKIKQGGKSFSHVYVVVPNGNTTQLNSRSAYTTIDPVVEGFNKEPNFTEKHDLWVIEPNSKNLSGMGKNRFFKRRKEGGRYRQQAATTSRMAQDLERPAAIQQSSDLKRKIVTGLVVSALAVGLGVIIKQSVAK